MSVFNPPPIAKGGLAIVDPESMAVRKMVAFQYNPETLTRTLIPQGAGGDSLDPNAALRLKGPPVEIIRLEAELDAAGQVDLPSGQGQNGLSVAPLLAALEMAVYPSSTSLQNSAGQALGGSLSVLPLPAPLTLFVWSRERVMPVRLTQITVIEEAFDPVLNPIRARVQLEMRVLSVSDLGFSARSGQMYMLYQRRKEELARQYLGDRLTNLNPGGLP